MNEIKIAAFLSYFSLGLSNIIGIVYTPFMLKMLGQSEYGLYSLVFSIVTTLALLDCGFGPAIVKFITKYKSTESNKLPSIIGTFFTLYTFIGLISFLFCILLAINSEKVFENSMTVQEIAKAKIMIWIIGIYISAGFPFSVLGSIIIAYERFVFLKIVNIIRVLLIPLIMTPLLLWGFKAIAMAIVLVGVGILIWFINLWFCLKVLKIKVHFGKIDWMFFREVSSFSIFVFFKMLLDRIYWSSGQFVLGAISGTVAVAVFSIALQMKGYYEVFARPIDSMFLPKCTLLSLDNNKDKISNLFIKVGRIQTYVLGYILCIYLLFGKSFIMLWAGSDYKESYYLSLMIMIPFTVPLIQSLGNIILQAYNKLKFQTSVYALIAIVVITLSVLLTPTYGSLGCAIALMVAIVIGEIIIMNIYYYKIINLNMKIFWLECFKILFPLAGLLIIFKLFLNEVVVISWLQLIMHVLIFTLICLIIIYLFVLNKYEKKILCQLFQKINNLLSC